jgi:DNA polymerase-4
VSDAYAAGSDNLRTWLGEREGLWLWDRIHGIDRAHVVTRGDNKSISRDETFPVDVDDDAMLRAELIRMVDRASGDLRDSELLARTITVRLRDYDFKDRQASKTVPAPILSDQAILRVARELLARLRAARPVPARLLGVGLGSLVHDDEDEPDQLSLLDVPAPAVEVESEKDRAVARVVDKLRNKLGDDAIALGRKPTRRRR